VKTSTTLGVLVKREVEMFEIACKSRQKVCFVKIVRKSVPKVDDRIIHWHWTDMFSSFKKLCKWSSGYWELTMRTEGPV